MSFLHHLQRGGFRRLAFTGAAFATGLGLAAQASAFSEDVCHANNGNLDLTRVENCWDLQCMDDGDSGACVIQGFADYFNATMIETPGDTTEPRSGLHFDMVWVLARAAGMNAGNATTLASYSQSPDFGGYTHHNQVGAMTYTTEDVPGLIRSNLVKGSPWFHFVPRTGNALLAPRTSDGSLPYNPASATAVFGSYEGPLNNMRNWAFSKAAKLCMFGLTNSSGACLTGQKIRTTYAMFGPTQAPVLQTMREVDLDPADPGLNGRLAGTLPAFGIYLHALGDRISHYYCSEESFLKKGLLNEWSLDYPNTQCGQTQHALMHYPEVGHEDIPERTLIAQNLFWKEINQWLAKNPSYRAHAALQIPGKGSISLSALNTDLENALMNGGAAQRMSAICSVAKNYGLGWHDGNANCQYSAP